MSRSAQLRRIVLALLLPPITGCHYGADAIKAPAIDADGAAEQAMELYDSNSDGRIAGAELDKVPALNSAMKTLDTNQDQAVSADEIAARVEAWHRSGLGLMSFTFMMTLDGSPVQGATVTFEPEAFLGDEVKPAVTTTDEFGGGGPSIPKELRPGIPPGIHLGFYKVKVSKIVNGKETIPAKFNEQTILGQEVAPDTPDLADLRTKYILSSKSKSK
jgi:hypothetical protein